MRLVDGAGPSGRALRKWWGVLNVTECDKELSPECGKDLLEDLGRGMTQLDLLFKRSF